jgi:glycosyltransferase involved in cell wall biosynthesis
MEVLSSDNSFPLVSIIMPAFNAELTLLDSIKSVLRQQYDNFELIVIDDSSTDSTHEIALRSSAIDSRIKVVSNTLGKGVASARNCGILNARGRFIAFLDSDDLWMPEKLHIQIQFMMQNDVGFCYSGYYRFHKNGFLNEQLVNVPSQVDYKILLKGNSIPCLTVVVDRNHYPELYFPVFMFLKKDYLRKIVGSYLGHEDYALWLTLLVKDKKNSVIGLQEPLAYYRVSNASLSGNKFKSAIKHWAVLRRYLRLSWLESSWYFLSYIAAVLRKYRMKIF